MLRTLQQYFVISDVIAYVARTCYNAVWRVVLEQCSWKQIGTVCIVYRCYRVEEGSSSIVHNMCYCVFYFYCTVFLCYCVTVYYVLYCATVLLCIVHMVVGWIQQ